MAGRYRLVGLVGGGGMGQVWHARDEVLAREVAVKVLRSEYAADPDFRVRFRAEALAAASVSHPHVTSVYDYGEESTASGEWVAYLVMELLPGRSVATALAERTTLPAADVYRMVEQVAAGLAAVHAKELVHRDIKPANLLLAADGTVKIADFGIARAADAVSLTRTGTIIGTAQYMSPEQALGQRATAASDLYSLGVIAYSALAGAPPFQAGGPVAVARAHVSEKPPPLPARTPLPLRLLVMQLLAKDPADRPASAVAVSMIVAQERGLDPAGVDVTRRLDAPDTELLPARSSFDAASETAWDAPREAPGFEGQVPPPYPGRGAGMTVALGAARAWMHEQLHRSENRPILRRWRDRRLLGVLAAIALLTVILVALTNGGAAASKVPNLTGQQLAGAETALQHGHLRATVKYLDSPAHPAGTVLSQAPPPGTSLKHGATVALDVATGKVNVTAASYTGRPYPQVQAQLGALGLHPSEVVQATDTTTAGDVISLTPTGQIPVGTAVTVTVATAAPATTLAAPTAPAKPAPGPKPGPAPKPAPGPGPAKHSSP
jgi:serine/threonine-protein kinase